MTDTQRRLTAALADRYRVERELGAGGMATVYLAHDLRHERDVAIKVLHPDLGAALGAERFLSEIKTTARLQHPHILPLLDSGAADGLLYYVMPYVRGETLRARLERETQLPIADAVRIATEVAEALQAAHALGIVHRDIKPENILLQDGHALVADFGIALAVQTAGGQRMTQTGLSLGTPQYMSPEQAMGERTIDARSDIYALGAVTYEMLTGDPPFTGASVQAIVARVLTERPGGIRAVRDTVPAGVEAAVLTALAKLPADRFASASAFADALRTPGGTPAPEGASVASAVRRRAVRPVAAMLLAGAAAVAGYALPRGGSAAPPDAASPILRFPISVDSPYRATSIGATLLVDGSGFAFIGDGPPGHGVYLRRFADTIMRYLPLPDASVGTIATPDGRALLNYVFTPSGLSRVMVLPLNGDPPRAWTDSLRYGLAVDADGWVWGSHHAFDGLTRVAPDGLATERLTRPDTAHGEDTHRFPVLLPAGKGAFFSIGSRDGRPITIGLYDAATRQVRRLGAGVPNALIGGRYLVYATQDQTLMAQRVDLDAMALVGPAVPLAQRAGWNGGVYGVMPSRSGDALYFLRSTGTWAIDQVTGSTVQRFLRGSGETPRSFRLAPDGRTVALETERGLEFRDRDGRVRRLPLQGSTSLASYLPDGSGVVFTRDGSRGTYSAGVTLEVAPADGALAPRRLDNGPAPLAPVFAGDPVAIGPRGVALMPFAVARSARELLYLPRDGSPPVRIADAGTPWSISPDGRFLAWTRRSSDPAVAYVVMVSALPPAAGTWEVGAGDRPRWAADSRTLYYTEPRLAYDTRPGAILQVRVEPGPAFRAGPVSVAASPPPNATTAWDVGRDGRIYWLNSTTREQLVYVHNFARLVDSLVTQAGGGGR
ncbi:MAG: protein kinase domain-containing protein [Gemmatimonas sp.]|uniref:protein kinase domain-containing protein n=1 Tax=Gemmatimonas sp. TaxID=1962908 RepID=UPI00391F3A88